MEYQYRKRLLPAAFSGVVLLLLLLWPAWWPLKLGGAAVGTLVGTWAGNGTWQWVRRQIDERRSLVSPRCFYGTALSGFLGGLVLLAWFSPGSLFYFIRLGIRSPDEIATILIFLGSMAFAFECAFLLRIREYERRKGPLRLLAVSPTSVTGAEGMIGAEGQVVRVCNPRGTVQLGPEVWNARSIDGDAIPQGSQVVVRDLEGLVVIVERKDTSPDQRGIGT